MFETFVLNKIRPTICQLFHVVDPWFLVNLPPPPPHWHYPIFVCRTININTVLDALMKAKHGFRSRLYAYVFRCTYFVLSSRTASLTSICHWLRYIDFTIFFLFFFFPPYRTRVPLKYLDIAVAAMRTNSTCYLNSVKYLPFHEIRSILLLLRKNISLFFD